MQKTTVITILLLLGISLFGSMAVAQFDLNSLRLDHTNQDKIQGKSFTERAKTEKISVIAAVALEITEFLTKVIGSVSFLVLIIAGIWMIISLGNEQQVTKAKGMFTYAILGLAISLAAYVLVIAVQGLLTE